MQIHTDAGITGEYLCGSNAEFAQMEMYTHYLLGRNPLKREQFYNEVKRALRKYDRMSMGMVDIALWDIAGKLYNAPVCELLGGFRETLPAYASTYHGDENGGLDTPEAFAEFAVAVSGDGIPSVQDTRLGQCAHRTGGSECAGSAQACRRPHGAHARPGL